jgi:hypothetical protein
VALISDITVTTLYLGCLLYTASTELHIWRQGCHYSRATQPALRRRALLPTVGAHHITTRTSATTPKPASHVNHRTVRYDSWRQHLKHYRKFPNIHQPSRLGCSQAIDLPESSRRYPSDTSEGLVTPEASRDSASRSPQRTTFLPGKFGNWVTAQQTLHIVDNLPNVSPHANAKCKVMMGTLLTTSPAGRTPDT